MATDVPNSLTLQVVHGQKKHDVKLQLSPHQAGDALCVQHLIDAIFNLTEIPGDAQKLIYKGKSLKDPAEQLDKLGLKNGAKVMLIGKKPIPADDKDTKALNEIEISLEKLSKKVSDITYELDGIHRGYLDKSQQADVVRQKEKQLGSAAEGLMKLLEKLDSLRFEESNIGGRGKRKTLVNKIQVLLNRIDGLSRGDQKEPV